MRWIISLKRFQIPFCFPSLKRKKKKKTEQDVEIKSKAIPMEARKMHRLLKLDFPSDRNRTVRQREGRKSRKSQVKGCLQAKAAPSAGGGKKKKKKTSMLLS